MHCLVTGATGYLGRALVPVLRAQGHAVTGQSARSQPVGHTGLAQIQRDFRDGASGIVPEGVDCVFHLAGIAHESADPASYARVNVEATLEIARDAQARGVRRLVFVSSVKAGLAQADGAIEFGEAGEVAEVAELAEESEVAGARPRVLDYASSKLAAETALSELCRGGAMELAIVRPALVYSADVPGHLRLLRRWVEHRLPRPPVGGGRSMIALTDLTRLLALLADVPLPAVNPLIVTDGEVYSTRRLHAALCRALQREPLLPALPRWLWHLGANARDRVQGHAVGSSWERLAGEECHAAQGLAELGFAASETFESSLGLGR